MTTSEDEAFTLAWPTESERSPQTPAPAPEPLVIEGLWADETPLKWAPAPADPAPRPPEPAPERTPRPAAEPVEVPAVDVVAPDPVAVARPIGARRRTTVPAPASPPRLTMRVRLARPGERSSRP